MDSEFESFVKNLTDEIHEEMRSSYGEEAFQRWRDKSYVGRMENPDACAVQRGGCGDTMAIYLRFENDRVIEASFETDGCGSSFVCGSIAAELAHGKNPDELIEITSDTIRENAGGLPADDDHCAVLAVTTLHEALNQYMLSRARGKKANGS